VTATNPVHKWRGKGEFDEDDGALLYQHLHRDDGACLGMIVRFRENGPTNAWCGYGDGRVTRIGPCSNDQAARAAVEHTLELQRGEVGP